MGKWLNLSFPNSDWILWHFYKRANRFESTVPCDSFFCVHMENGTIEMKKIWNVAQHNDFFRWYMKSVHLTWSMENVRQSKYIKPEWSKCDSSGYITNKTPWHRTIYYVNLALTKSIVDKSRRVDCLKNKRGDKLKLSTNKLNLERTWGQSLIDLRNHWKNYELLGRLPKNDFLVLKLTM